MITIIKIERFWQILIVMLVIMVLVAGCGSPDTAVSPEEEAPPAEEEASDDPSEPADEDAEESVTLTIDEIAYYDGQDGRPAYIVVDGIVYDVTNVPPWSLGTHYGFEAGADVTEALQSAAPHGAAQLNQAVVVGTIAD